MLFQGQEFASSAPFLYFADHRGELGAKVREGRADFLTQFPSIASPEMIGDAARPVGPGHVRALQARFRGARTACRASTPCTAISSGCDARDPVFRAQRPRGVDGAVLGPEAFVLRFFGSRARRSGGADRLLLVNLGVDLALDPAPEPLLAPPADTLWRVLWSSDDVALWRAGHRAPRDARQLAHSRPRRRRARADARGRGVRSGARRGRGDRGSRDAPRGAPAPGDHLVPVLRRSLTSAGESVREAAVGREWLVTNGLGGFAAGTVAGVPTRRYHGLLVAALPTPLGRTLMLNHLSELLRLSDGTRFEIGGQERAGSGLEWPGAQHLAEFRLDSGLPVWRYELGATVVEKRVHMLHQQNTVHVTYHLIHGGPVRIKLRPALHVRPHEGSVHGAIDEPYTITAIEDRLELSTTRGYPPLRLKIYGRRATFALDSGKLDDVHYRAEAQRGYADVGELWSPGYWSVDLTADTSTTLVASTEGWDTIGALLPEQAAAAERERRERLLAAAAPAARSGIGAELVLAADQFVITPAGRREDAARARAAGDEVRSIIAGYHWFTDWGRDTMISLEGLTLHDGPPRRSGLHPAHVRASTCATG